VRVDFHSGRSPSILGGRPGRVRREDRARRPPRHPAPLAAEGVSKKRANRPARVRLDRNDVSEFTAARLSLYVRGLAALEAEGVHHVSSKEFARRFELNSAQIRKDLATFGEFGVRGVGYEVSELKCRLISILGLDRARRVVIVGAGHLGQALADYGGFRSKEFLVVALFDADPAKIGTKTRAGVEIRDVSELSRVVEGQGVEIGVLAVPAAAAESVCRRCAAAGLRAILNFAPIRLNAPPGVRIKNVDFKINLETLAFYIPDRSRREAPAG
jgi:redox-sensing transcriptional repressor